jgi:hypothetical protein
MTLVGQYLFIENYIYPVEGILCFVVTVIVKVALLLAYVGDTDVVKPIFKLI